MTSSLRATSNRLSVDSDGGLGDSHRSPVTLGLPQQQQSELMSSPSPPPPCAEDGPSSIFATEKGGDAAAASERAERRCWRLFLIGVSLCFLFCVVAIELQWHRQEHETLLLNTNNAGGTSKRKKINRFSHSLEYFLLCVAGGLLSGAPHLLLTPIDLIKCRMQVGHYRSLKDGLKRLLTEARSEGRDAESRKNVGNNSGSPILLRIAVLGRVVRGSRYAAAFLGTLYAGWVPTLIGYCLQGAIKFGLYEYFKYRYFGLLIAVVAPADQERYLVVVFLIASASAEFFADVALAPWETLKVQIQTSTKRSSQMAVSRLLPKIWLQQGLSGFYHCLVPLWGRQVPYTMVKFTTFEKSAQFLMWALYGQSLVSTSVTYWQRAIVTLGAGYIAGTLCAIVSQPADTLVSRLSSAKDQNTTLSRVLQEVGWSGLWRGLSTRILMVGALSSAQWAVYDGFKVLVGAGT